MGKILKVNYPDRVVVAALYDLVLDESEGKWVESPCYIQTLRS